MTLLPKPRIYIDTREETSSKETVFNKGFEIKRMLQEEIVLFGIHIA